MSLLIACGSACDHEGDTENDTISESTSSQGTQESGGTGGTAATASESTSSQGTQESGGTGGTAATASESTSSPELDVPAGTDGTTDGTTGGSQTPTLACFRWNGMQEEVFTLDPMTGMDTLLGTVGDLRWWSGATAVDPLAERLYAVGDNDTGYFLYVLDSTTGALLMSLPIAGAVTGLQVAPDGSLLHARWNGMSEDLVRLDPATGVETVIGTVGDLQWWSGETAINTTSAVYYAIGNNGSNDKLWVLDAGSGALLSEMVLPGAIGSGLQLNQDGDLVFLRWNGSEEEVVSLDPVTGTLAVIGVAGTLYLWSGVTALAPGSDELYVFGSDAADDEYLWTVDARTGALLQTTPLALGEATGCLAW